MVGSDSWVAEWWNRTHVEYAGDMTFATTYKHSKIRNSEMWYSVLLNNLCKLLGSLKRGIILFAVLF